MATQTPLTEMETLTALNRLLVKALRSLGAGGREHEACVLAAEGWSLLRHASPREAERLNGVMHYLTAPRTDRGRPSPTDQGREEIVDDCAIG